MGFTSKKLLNNSLQKLCIKQYYHTLSQSQIFPMPPGPRTLKKHPNTVYIFMVLYNPHTNYTLCKKTILQTYYLSICVLFLSHNWTYCIYKPICSSQRCAQRYISQADNPRKKWSSSSENVKMLQRFGDEKKTEACTPPPIISNLPLSLEIRGHPKIILEIDRWPIRAERL
jgi:hypothetical protein